MATSEKRQGYRHRLYLKWVREVHPEIAMQIEQEVDRIYPAGHMNRQTVMQTLTERIDQKSGKVTSDA